jgi:hypothetical protein
MDDARGLADKLVEAWQRMTAEDQATVPVPPQYGVACAVPTGSSSVAGYTLDQLMQGVVC